MTKARSSDALRGEIPGLGCIQLMNSESSANLVAFVALMSEKLSKRRVTRGKGHRTFGNLPSADSVVKDPFWISPYPGKPADMPAYLA